MRAWISRHQGFVTVAAVLVVVAVALGVAGCSNGFHNSHDYNAPTPVRNWAPPNGWTRIETPGNFPNAVFACHGTDGIYQSSDNASSMIVVGHDGNCTGGK